MQLGLKINRTPSEIMALPVRDFNLMLAQLLIEQQDREAAEQKLRHR